MMKTIKIQQQQVAFITLKQSLKLLDLRESGAWDAGSVARQWQLMGDVY